MNARLEPLVANWRARSVREQRLIAALAAVAGVAILFLAFSALTEAIHKGRQKRAALSGELAVVEVLAKEAAELKARPALTPLAAEPLLTLLKTAAAQAGLDAAGSRWAVDGESGVVHEAEQPFDAWLAWAGKMQATQQVRLASFDATPAGPGRVRLVAHYRHAGTVE
ncbi:type II secretion system protein GspM [Crenobacter cavernae]|uniref:Type II secretion system protein M n=1 Tax=Crenobacter cavernae TaxID=2290923 RepID=A0ABY0FB89_9NEIS|nr:type II secretion system protein GspM [Crenobacter cavernae]RXZ43219.1 hypothetical protein EBB06_10660 [Crenobacter cavernae]